MIFGYTSRWEQEKHTYPAVFDEAMQFLQRSDLNDLAPGKYPIRGEDIYAMVIRIRTEDEHSRRPEIHKTYVDIQVLLEGREKIMVNPRPPLGAPVDDLFESRDVAFYSPDPAAFPMMLLPGQYLVLLPGQQHTPICAWDEPEEVFKVVLKIKASLFS